jgi:acetyl-CoA carboxylase/biotin carboxylase 1
LALTHTPAQATPEDLNANAEYIRQANAYVEVPGGKNSNNYANVKLIVDIAKREGVDAVWPGWGHASENPKLPATLKAAGITFIGPTSPVMSVLGDKIAANILAQTAKVPSIPWSGDGLTAELTAEGTIPQDVFDKACVTTVDEALAAAERIGFPVMLKASEGGGGKGIRMSADADALRVNFEQVKAEVPGSPMFMMQLCTNARHLEVQIVGDEHGNAVAFSGRDCSTQRRFQKIFEEGPPTIADPDIFHEMELAAQRLTQNIGYIGAGTVEYLYNAASKKFFFLELNPRLQVEHPVTEGITDVNLPATQLQVAMGIPLFRMPDVRRFYSRPDWLDGSSKIDFMTERYQLPKRHVIAARITAENPDEGFKPTSGSIDRIFFQSTPNVWGYFSVGANGGVHEFADSQFGHLFATGETREDARKALVLALKGLVVRGEIRTAVEYLVQLLETPAFRDNTIDTSWLDGIIRSKELKLGLPPALVVTSAAIVRAHRHVAQEEAAFSASLAKGQLSLAAIDTIAAFGVEVTYQDTKHSFKCTRTSTDALRLSLGGGSVDVRLREQSDGTLLAIFGGETHQLLGFEEPLGLRLVLDGTTVLLPTQFDPSELRTDVTGKVVRFLQQDGGDVEKGKPFAEVEAMKMVMPLLATESGRIKHAVSPGSIIEAGDLLASLTLRDPGKAKKIVAFTGSFDFGCPGWTPPADGGFATAAERFIGAQAAAQLILDGFDGDAEGAVQALLSAVTDSALNGSTFGKDRYVHAQSVVAALLNRYAAVETEFVGRTLDDTIARLVKANASSIPRVAALAAAHRALPRRNTMMLSLMRQLRTLPQRCASGPISWEDDHASLTEDLTAALGKMAAFFGKEYGEVALTASHLVAEKRMPPLTERVSELRDVLTGRVGLSRPWGSAEPGDRQALVESPTLAVDLLPSLLEDADPSVRATAAEVYVRRVYRAHNILSLEVKQGADAGVPGGASLVVQWRFQFKDTPPRDSPVRVGTMVVVPELSALGSALPATLGLMKSTIATDMPSGIQFADWVDPVNVMHLVLLHQPESETLSADAAALLAPKVDELLGLGVKFANLVACKPLELPRYHTFTAALRYAEDQLYRGERPTFAHLLELSRLTNYDMARIPTVNRDLHVYVGMGNAPGISRAQRPCHLFLRRISHSKDVSAGGLERVLVKALDSVELAMLDPRAAAASSTRLYFNILPTIDEGGVAPALRLFSERLSSFIGANATRLLSLRVDEIEIKLRVADPAASSEGQEAVPLRLMASSLAGQWLQIDAYKDQLDPVTGAAVRFCHLSQGDEDCGQEDECFLEPYPAAEKLQRKRAAARRTGSTYAYDFLGLMEKANVAAWQAYLDSTPGSPLRMPKSTFTSVELVQDKLSGELAPEVRRAGLNTVGMVAWLCVLRTPQYPAGREVVLVANDTTHQSGSFGVPEDEFFFKASEMARHRGIPRVYIACNSGARIGLVEELKPFIKVAWKDAANPSLGFEHLYLTPEDYATLPEGTVQAHEATGADGAKKWVLDAVIGAGGAPIGVENLRGSGLIAGETSRAYAETFTLSYITGRSVGIGAYLCRLGQRNIQMREGPLILTGYGALNKLLGRDVYTSQDQLGGPQVMFPNGVSHLVVEDDQQGVAAILNWLSYVPSDVRAAPPAVFSADPWNRKVAWSPPPTPYDPRNLLAGAAGANGEWAGGFFDNNSFTETLGGWGKTVVTGRARLGGVPCGVIAVETRLQEQRIPADPANPESRETTQQQAGQVWFPDSAYKTAQAIADFGHGENLPLFIFANWRGFSGGTRDMANEILKFGAMIVDQLRTYQHPVFVYIPPRGELRGGAWVVVDPTINEEKMEMYADAASRGGILEPPGICEVKFRKADQVKLMHRLDSSLKTLDADAAGNAGAIASREEALLPFYTQVAHEFADLHDRAGRMKAKGVIREVLTWETSRAFFYCRLRRRLAEDRARDAFKAANPELSRDAVTSLLQRAMASKVGASVSWTDDAAVADWLESDASSVTKLVTTEARTARVASVAKQLAALDPAARRQAMEQAGQ